MHLALAVCLLILAIAIIALHQWYSPDPLLRGRPILDYLNPMSPRTWAAAAIGGAAVALAI